MTTLTKERQPEPTWEIAHPFPPQGQWSVADYLRFDEGRIIEYDDGEVEIHAYPSTQHQSILADLAFILYDFATPHKLGTTLFAPLPVQLWERKFREPDIVFMLTKNADRRGEQFWFGADLVIEVVSPDDRGRDLRVKRREYAMAGIPEYWIVDPDKQQIIVLALDGEQYLEHGSFDPGTQATSLLLEGFSVVVSEVFAER